jgi:hypothetical protein
MPNPLLGFGELPEFKAGVNDAIPLDKKARTPTRGHKTTRMQLILSHALDGVACHDHSSPGRADWSAASS